MEKLSQYGRDRYEVKIGRARGANSQEPASRTGSVNHDDSNIARVTSMTGTTFMIVTETGVMKAELTGRLLYAAEKHEQPKVGDWVSYLDYDQMALINEVLPRYTELYRKTSGKTFEKQVMVANADRAVIIQGMDDDFNINRIERYIVQVITCKIEPVVILNKSDLAEDIPRTIQDIQKLQRDVAVYTCSVKTGDGIDAIREKVFLPGQTSVLIGSSGVGKSSLLNLLTGTDRKTSGISESTGKGKHTTTTRDLFLLENGAIVVDTPGMREFGIGFEEDAEFEDQFPVIARYAGDCRFRDCSHTDEEGCSVIAALERGELDAGVYDNFLKLMKEQERFQTSKAEQNRQGKQFGKMVKEAKEYRRKYKY